MRDGGKASKETILKTAARLFQRQGYHATGLNQIVEESGAPKGSLYYYFPGGKEELAAEAILWTQREIGEKIRRFLARYDQPVEAIQSLIRATARSVSDIESIIPCTVSLLSLEMSLSSEPVRLACEATMDAWGALFAQKLEGLCGPERAGELGPLIQTLIDGALIRSLTHRDVTPLLRIAEAVPTLLGMPAEQEARHGDL